MIRSDEPPPEGAPGRMSFLDNLKNDVVYLKGALRALKMTTPIAKNPTRVFPFVIGELAEKYGDAPALISDRERFSYRELAARANRYARWCRQQNLQKGDTRLPADAEPAGIHGGVARHHQCRRRRGADQLQSGRDVARPLRRHRRAEARRGRGRARRRVRHRACADQVQPQDLVPRRERRHAAPRYADRHTARSRARRLGARQPDHRGPRALHLHLRHHGTAEGRQHQPLPRDARELCVCRGDGHQARRPHVRLPADVPHHRRRGGDRLGAAQRRLGGDPREVLGARILGRRGALRLHAVPVHRRALPLSRQLAAAPEREQAPAARRLRQRASPRSLGRISETLPHPARSSNSTARPKAT